MNGMENKIMDENTARVIDALTAVLQHDEEKEARDPTCSSSDDDDHVSHAEMEEITSGFKPHGLRFANGKVHAYRVKKTAYEANGKVKHANQRKDFEWPSFGPNNDIVEISAQGTYVYMHLRNNSTGEEKHCIFNKQDPVLCMESADVIFYNFLGDVAIFLRRKSKFSTTSKLKTALDERLSLIISEEQRQQLAAFATSSVKELPEDAIEKDILFYPLKADQALQLGAQTNTSSGERTPPKGFFVFQVCEKHVLGHLSRSDIVCINQAISLDSIVPETIWFLFPTILVVSHVGSEFSISTSNASDTVNNVWRKNLGVVVYTIGNTVKMASLYQLITYPSEEGIWHTTILSRTFVLKKNSDDVFVLKEVEKYADRLEINGGKAVQKTDVYFTIAKHTTNDVNQAKTLHDNISAETQSRFSGYHAAIVHPCDDDVSLGLIAVRPETTGTQRQSVCNFTINNSVINRKCGLRLGNIFANGDPRLKMAASYCMDGSVGVDSPTIGYFDIQKTGDEDPKLRLELSSMTGHGPCTSHFVTDSSGPLDNFDTTNVWYASEMMTKLVRYCFQMEDQAKKAGSKQTFEDDLKKMRVLFKATIEEKMALKDRLENAKRLADLYQQQHADLMSRYVVLEEELKKDKTSPKEDKALHRACARIADLDATIANLTKKNNALEVKVAEMQTLRQTTAATAVKKEQYITNLQHELGVCRQEAQKTNAQMADLKTLLQHQTSDLKRGEAEREKIIKKAEKDLAQLKNEMSTALDKCRNERSDKFASLAQEIFQKSRDFDKAMEKAQTKVADLTEQLAQQQQSQELQRTLANACADETKREKEALQVIIERQKKELEKLQEAASAAAAAPPSPITTEESREQSVSPCLSVTSASTSQELENCRTDNRDLRADAQRLRDDIRELRAEIKTLREAEKSLKEEMENRGRIIGALRSQLEMLGNSQQQQQQSIEQQQAFAALQQEYVQLKTAFDETAVNYQKCFDELFFLKQQHQQQQQQQQNQLRGVHFQQRLNNQPLLQQQQQQRMPAQRRNNVAHSPGASPPSPVSPPVSPAEAE